MRFTILALLFTIGFGSGCSLIVEEAAGTDDTPTLTETGTNDTLTQTEQGTDDTDTGVQTSSNTDDTGVQTSSETDTATIDTGSTDEPVEVRGMAINSGAEFTNKPTVELSFDVVNATQMRIRNENPLVWEGWMPFKPFWSWVLMPNEGKHTVTAEFRNDVSGPVSASDAIILDIQPPNAPTVTLVGDPVTPKQVVEFKWSSNGGGIGEFRYKMDDDNLDIDAVITADKMLQVSLFDGDHTLYVQERDEAGNWSASGWDSVYVDSSGPEILDFSFREYAAGPPCLYTSQWTVTLFLQADDGDGSGVKDMQLRNENGGWTPWQSVEETLDWTLPFGYGRTSVALEVRDYVDNVSGMILDIYRDDSYEQCLGNDTLDSAWNVGNTLDDDYSGSILKDGPAVLGELPDVMRIEVPEWRGGTLEVFFTDASASSAPVVNIYTDKGVLVESAQGFPGNTTVIWLGGQGKYGELCPGCYCNDGVDFYYVEVRMSGPTTKLHQLYDITYSGSSDACL